MNVLLHYFSTLGGLGGIEKTVLDLAIGLKRHGCQTGIVEMGTEAGPKRFIEGDIPVWTVAKPSYARWHRPRSWASNARSVWQFSRALSEFQPDIINVHFPCSQIPVLNWLAPLPRRWRLVATVQNSEIRCLPKSDARAMREYTRFYELVDAVTAVSKDMLDETIQEFPCVRTKGHVVLNGIAEEWFDDDGEAIADEGSALFVGRLEHVKGVDILLEAWRQVAHRVRWKRLLLAGDGDEAAAYRAQVGERGLSNSVAFLGKKSHFELRRLYRDAGVVLLPSRREGLPLSLLEAGACGAICIASDISGNREIIKDGVNGFLVKPESAEFLADALVAASELPPQRREAMKVSARERIRTNFAAQEVLGSYIHLFRSLL